MMLALCLLAALSIESPDEFQAGSRTAAPAVLEPFQETLEKDPDLLRHHRGYLQYLRLQPKLNAAEEAWLELRLQTDFDYADRTFDEALNADIAAQALFDQFYDQLARDMPLQGAVDALQRLQLSEKPRRTLDLPQAPTPPSFSDAIEFLRAHPDASMRFLQNPERFNPLPDALGPLLKHFDVNPGVLKELQDAFQTISGNPLAQVRIMPWWQNLAAFNTKYNGAYRLLTTEFEKHPNHFWAWHQRQLLLANDAQARDWIRYWHRRIRRTPALAKDTAYLRSLQLLRRQPETAARLEQDWAKRFGPPAPWPPKESPPTLSPLQDTTPNDAMKKPTISVPTIQAPQKPILRQRDNRLAPAMPAMPEKPIMPQRPTKPEKPPKPKPELSEPNTPRKETP